MKYLRFLTQGFLQPDDRHPAAPAHDPAPARAARRDGFYVPVRVKFGGAIAVAALWTLLSAWIALPWVDELARHVGVVAAWLVIGGIAVVPGFMNAFLVVSLLLDRRPPLRETVGALPGISILVAAYNEQDSIAAHRSRASAASDYPGPVQVIVVDDGSIDATAAVLAGIRRPWLEVVDDAAQRRQVQRAERRRSSACAIALTITVDGDSYLYRDALRNLVGRYLSATRSDTTRRRRRGAGAQLAPQPGHARRRSGTTSTASRRSSGCRACTRARWSRRARSRCTRRRGCARSAAGPRPSARTSC
ncbi:MAG: glycosyltransferase [Comamonadaceae bacterium]|nr:glycosyltransferase [Comamonadaceae bacterium]